MSLSEYNILLSLPIEDLFIRASRSNVQLFPRNTIYKLDGTKVLV